MLQKVNRKFLSRCRRLGRFHGPTPPDPPVTEAECSAEPATANPPARDINTFQVPAPGNVGAERGQDVGSRMEAPLEGMTSDPECPEPGGQGCEGPSELEGGESSCAWEEGDEEEVRVTLRPRWRWPRYAHSRPPFRRHSWEPGKMEGLTLGPSQRYSTSRQSLQDEELELRAVGSAAQVSISTGRLSPREHEDDEEETDPLALSRHWLRESRAGFMSTVGEILDEGAQTGLRTDQRTTPASRPPGHRNASETTETTHQGAGTGGKGHRTLSFLKKMAGLTKTKEKLKEREKETREREMRITNGHLFNTITVSGNTLCYVCNKSIISKEAFACPNCNVTIHKSCKDALSSCTKVKQKQLKAAQAKNNSALHSVSMRNKAPLGRERPSSAIYPSDSLRQSPLFSQLSSRRGRTPFQSLSKSVSTNNIGNLNDDTPLGIRRILSQSTDSLNMKNRTLSIESLIDEGAEGIFQQLMGDLEADEKCFEADSWSLAVETGFLQQLKKDVMKRQDVIYELIQTEVHHMKTLKIMSEIFRKGMLEELQMDHCTVDAMFPALDDLIEFHVQLLSRLLERRRESLMSGSNNNFVIIKLGDILVSQFSGQSADLMRRAYAEFCSRHTKAVKLYKELFTREKRFQQFVRRMMRNSVLRRYGIQECILLVTQRITKYPVLLDRILQNTKGNEEDRKDLTNSLALLKDLISAVDQDVHDCEKRYRLQDVYNRMDPKAVAPMHSGRTFRREDMIRRKLVHDGFLLWKTATGRFKDIQVLLLTDVLVLLQEKDQRYSFPALDNKSSVIPLHKLIVRDIANQEKGLFLISAASQSPEMYELHTSSRDERNVWMKVIQQTVNVCPEVDDFSMEIETKEMLRGLADEIQQRDRGITELLEERAGLFQQILQLQSGADLGPELSLRKLFRSESIECPKGEKLINNAIKEVQSLAELMMEVSGGSVSVAVTDTSQGNQGPGGTENASAPTISNSNEELPSVNGSTDVCRSETYPDSSQDRNGNQILGKSHNEEIILGLCRLSSILHGLQAIVVKQDSVLEAQKQQLGEQRERLCRQSSRGEGPLGDQERLRSAEQQREELVGLRRQHGLLQEEFQRCRRSYEEKTQELRALEARLHEAHRSQDQLRGQLEELSRQAPALAQAQAQAQASAQAQAQASAQAQAQAQASAQLRRGRRKAHTRQLSLPSAQFTGLSPTQNSEQRRRSMDASCLQASLDFVGEPREGLNGQERPVVRDGLSEGAESGTPHEVTLAPHQEARVEEEDEEEAGSQSEAEEVSGPEETQNIPEGDGQSGGGVASNDEELAEEDEEDDDDLYY